MEELETTGHAAVLEKCGTTAEELGATGYAAVLEKYGSNVQTTARAPLSPRTLQCEQTQQGLSGVVCLGVKPDLIFSYELQQSNVFVDSTCSRSLD